MFSKLTSNSKLHFWWKSLDSFSDSFGVLYLGKRVFGFIGSLICHKKQDLDPLWSRVWRHEGGELDVNLPKTANCFSIPGNGASRSRLWPASKSPCRGRRTVERQETELVERCRGGGGSDEGNVGLRRYLPGLRSSKEALVSGGQCLVSSEQSRYDHPAMKMIRKAKRSRRETCRETRHNS